MRREIKFRFYLVNVKQYMSMEDFILCCEEGDYSLIDVLSGKDKNVIAEQFTGVKNNDEVEVFEGDIFVDSESEYTYGPHAKVEYDESQGKFILVNWKGEYSGDLEEWLECSIVGNVHQNPELLS